MDAISRVLVLLHQSCKRTFKIKDCYRVFVYSLKNLLIVQLNMCSYCRNKNLIGLMPLLDRPTGLASLLMLLIKKYHSTKIAPVHRLRTPREEIAFTAGRKFNPNPKFLGMAEAYFVCHIDPIFQISLIYAFIGCP